MAPRSRRTPHEVTSFINMHRLRKSPSTILLKGPMRSMRSGPTRLEDAPRGHLLHKYVQVREISFNLSFLKDPTRSKRSGSIRPEDTPRGHILYKYVQVKEIPFILPFSRTPRGQREDGPTRPEVFPHSFMGKQVKGKGFSKQIPIYLAPQESHEDQKIAPRALVLRTFADIQQDLSQRQHSVKGIATMQSTPLPENSCLSPYRSEQCNMIYCSKGCTRLAQAARKKQWSYIIPQ